MIKIPIVIELERSTLYRLKENDLGGRLESRANTEQVSILPSSSRSRHPSDDEGE